MCSKVKDVGSGKKGGMEMKNCGVKCQNLKLKRNFHGLLLAD